MSQNENEGITLEEYQSKVNEMDDFELLDELLKVHKNLVTLNCQYLHKYPAHVVAEKKFKMVYNALIESFCFE